MTMAINKTIFRINKPDNYVTINRHLLEDVRLSYEARGLLACMLAKPNDWIFHITFFIKNSPAGRDKVRRIFNELIAAGYIVKTDGRSRTGKFGSPQYTVYESPVSDSQANITSPKPDKPSTINPLTDNPATVNPSLLSKQLVLNKQVTNKTTTNREDLIWTKKLSQDHQESIGSMITNMDNQDVQLLLDELAGQIENIKNPVGYFRTLLNSYLSGEFVPAKALQIQSSRKQRVENERAVERSNHLHDERVNKLLERYEEEHPSK